MRQFHKIKYYQGDKVYWNDPDDGICSGFYTIAQVLDVDILLLERDNDGCRFQVFTSEIRNDTMPKHWS